MVMCGGVEWCIGSGVCVCGGGVASVVKSGFVGVGG